MSWPLVAAVYASTLPGWLKPYAAACASFAAEDGTRIYPSVARVAGLVGRHERATQYALQHLRALGILEVLAPGRRHQATHYRFNAAALPQPSDGTQLRLFTRPQGYPHAKVANG